MKLFTCKQIAEIDRQTILRESILSIDLMERASQQLSDWIIQHIGINQSFFIFAGPGNNGGDALALARMLAGMNCLCEVFLVPFGRELKGDPASNLQRLKDQNKVEINQIDSEDPIPEIPADVVVIDGLFGSGLNKPLNALAAKLVHAINQSRATIISIDVPSGLFCEDNSQNNLAGVIRATFTLTFQFPKLSFFFPENVDFVGNWKVLPIGLHPEAILQTETNYFSLAKTYVSGTLKKRSKFSHKGTYGHALLIAGSYGKMGAAVLASKASLRSGLGLLTSHIPKSGYQIIQTSVAEAMTSIDNSESFFSQVSELESYSAIGIGPGLGRHPETQLAVKTLLQKKPEKLIMDADALNILSENKDWYKLLPENTILTPHPKEFERLAGASANSYEQLQKQIQFSVDYKIIVVCKGAHTSITTPDGCAFFNNSGNPGMATAGSGDVLTGIILGLLAQNYTPEEATLMGVYLHGLAGDLAAGRIGQHALIAGDIIEQLGEAFLCLE